MDPIFTAFCTVRRIFINTERPWTNWSNWNIRLKTFFYFKTPFFPKSCAAIFHQGSTVIWLLFASNCVIECLYTSMFAIPLRTLRQLWNLLNRQKPLSFRHHQPYFHSYQATMSILKIWFQKCFIPKSLISDSEISDGIFHQCSAVSWLLLTGIWCIESL